MSSTRYAPPGAPLRQDRFRSSPALRDDGLKPALVAARCSVLEDAAAREAIWYLQARSHQPGGLRAVAAELRNDFKTHICPRSLVNYEGRKDQKLAPDQVRKLREEFDGEERFLFRGEFTPREQETLRFAASEPYEEWNKATIAEIHARSNKRPESFTVADFFNRADFYASNYLESYLTEICLNPEEPFRAPCYFQDLPSALAANAEQWALAHALGAAETTVGKSLEEAIHYARETGSVILFSGANGIGKSFQARSFCERWPGRARYVQAPAGNDRRTFFKAFVDAYGGPAGTAWKALELQERIEEIAAQSGVVLVIDDALQLLPDREREATPDRIDWIVTALAERGVPAVLITNPSFDVRLLAIQERSRWSMHGFNERVLRRPVPALGQPGIEAVAAAMFPTAGTNDLAAMVYATTAAGAGSLHFLDKIQRGVAFVAGKSAVTAAHFRQALSGYAIPHATALSTALTDAKKKAVRKFTRTMPGVVSASPAPLGEAPAAAARTAREALAPLPEHGREMSPKAPGREVAPEGILTVSGE